MKKVALKNIVEVYISSHESSAVCCYINIFAVVVKEKERGMWFY